MFEKTELYNVLTIDSVFTIHYFDYTPSFNFPGESHNFWEMVFVDNGEVIVEGDGIPHLLKSGEAFFHPPGEYHSIRANNTYACVVIITFEMQSSCAEYLVGQHILGGSEKAIISEIVHDATLTFAQPLDIVHQTVMIKRDDAPFGSEQLIKSHIEQLLIHLVRNKLPPQRTQNKTLTPPENEQVIIDILKILENNLCGNITLDEISAQMNFSKSFLKSHFKAVMGCGIHQMYLQLKISSSKKLLNEGKHSILEISETLGFSSIHHFSKIFKQFVGMPPSQYVKSVRRRALL